MVNTVLALIGLICIRLVSGESCPSLTAKHGVELVCQDPATGSSLSCDGDMPVGTVGFYKCNNFYASPFGDSEGGRVTCNSNGKWGRLTQFEDFTCRLDCGKPTAAVTGETVVVVFGETATRENFPWHAAIFRSDGPGTEFYFFCGGSLVSPSNKGFLVLTAAHCVTDSLRTHRIRPLGDFKVVLGAVSSELSVNEATEGVQIFHVKAAKIHPNYNFDNIQNDVAIMKLTEKVKLTNYVSPACFPSSDMANMQIVGNGLIPGFGVDQSTQISAKLNFARLPVVEDTICNFALGKQLTSIEFCAGYETGSSICSGDSGGGLVFLDDRTKKLYVQGIASNVDRRPLQDLRYCQNYNTFTRVSSFVDWVQDQVDEFFFDDDDNENVSSRLPGTAASRPKPTAGASNGEFRVTVYRDIDDLDSYIEWRMTNCSSVPNNWNQGVFWIDIHGKCLQFYEGRFCSGRSLQLQSTPQSSIFKWSFPDYNIRSVNICPQIESGGSSNNRPIQGGGSGPSNGNNRPPPPPPGGSGDGSGNDYEKVGLQMHNLYRMKHGVPSVTLSETLSREAQRYADQLIRQNSLQPSGDGGENLFENNGSSESPGAVTRQAVELWYNTISKYDFDYPSATSFSQLVWKSTREIGIGYSRYGRRTVIVARYSPPGNVYVGGGGDRTRYFRENVFPPRR